MESKMDPILGSKVEWLPIGKACASIFIIFIVYIVAKYNIINIIVMIFAGKITLAQIWDLIVGYLVGDSGIKKERSIVEKETAKSQRLTPSVDI